MPKKELLPNGGRAQLAVMVLGIVGLVTIVHCCLAAYLLAVWGEVEDPEPLVQLETALGIADLASVLLCGITFLFWFRRAYGNAHALGLQNGYRLGWAVGGWFVPLLNLVRPVEIAGEMWRHAGPARVGSSAIVGSWWAAFLISGVVDKIAVRMMESPTVETVRQGLQVQLAANFVNLACAVLAVVIVRRLTAAHEAMSSVQQARVFD